MPIFTASRKRAAMKMGQRREAGGCRPLTGGVTLRSKGTLSSARMKMTPNSVFSFFVGDKKGAFRNTIILADSGSTMGSNNRLDTTMGSAFVRKGATAYAGFLNTVDGGYAKPYLREVIDGLLAGKSMGQSMGGADAKVGQSQKTWYEKTWKGKSYWNWGKDTPSGAYKLDCYPRYVGNRNGRLWYFLQNATYH